MLFVSNTKIWHFIKASCLKNHSFQIFCSWETFTGQNLGLVGIVIYRVWCGLWASNSLLNFQVVILIIIPKMGGSSYLNTKNLLKFVVIFQYVPRFVRIYPLYKEVTTSGILTETAWAGAAFNLFLYMLASHVSLTYLICV